MTTSDPEARKLRRKRVLLWVLLVLSVPLYWYADYVWGDCGYDCAIFGYKSGLGWGPAAMPALYVAVVVFLVCAVWLAVSHVSERRQKKSGG
jgi:hypothetical protein